MEKTLDSGATLNITVSSFAIGNKLLKTVARELEVVGINVGLGSGRMEEFFKVNLNKDDVFNTIKNVVARLVASEAVEAVLWECMERATYKPVGSESGLKITRQTFEDEKARGDYLIVAKEVLVANLSPFFPGLLSKLSTGIKKATSDQTSP